MVLRYNTLVILLVLRDLINDVLYNPRSCAYKKIHCHARKAIRHFERRAYQIILIDVP